MQIYKIRQIKSIRDRRALDLFVKGNPSNGWLSLEDATRYTYETNKPKAWQLKAVHSFLFSICKREFSSNPHAVLEYSTEAEQNRWSYRLMNADTARSKPISTRTTESMVNEVIDRHSRKLDQKQMSEI